MSNTPLILQIFHLRLNLLSYVMTEVQIEDLQNEEGAVIL